MNIYEILNDKNPDLKTVVERLNQANIVLHDIVKGTSGSTTASLPSVPASSHTPPLTSPSSGIVSKPAPPLTSLPSTASSTASSKPEPPLTSLPSIASSTASSTPSSKPEPPLTSPSSASVPFKSLIIESPLTLINLSTTLAELAKITKIDATDVDEILNIVKNVEVILNTNSIEQVQAKDLGTYVETILRIRDVIKNKQLREAFVSLGTLLTNKSIPPLPKTSLGGKSKKRASKKRGGSYNLPAMYNADGLISAGNDPVTAAGVHVGTMLNTPSPFSSGMNTDFNDSTRTIPKTILNNIVPKVGSTEAPKVASTQAQSGGKSRKRT